MPSDPYAVPPDAPPPSPPAVDRAESLRALAHPLRSRILAQLRVHGEATATTLASALGTHTGATSYHLRRLEAAGLAEDTGHGDGRRRVWAASAATIPQAAEEPLDEDEAAAALWLQRDYVQHFAERADRWVTEQDDWPATWRDACGLADHPLLVTTEQLTALAAEIGEVMARYRRIGAGSPGARRVAAYTCLLPVDPPTGQRRPVS